MRKAPFLAKGIGEPMSKDPMGGRMTATAKIPPTSLSKPSLRDRYLAGWRLKVASDNDALAREIADLGEDDLSELARALSMAGSARAANLLEDAARRCSDEAAQERLVRACAAMRSA